MQKKIGEVAESLGVSVDTLRYYEKIHLLGEINRNSRGVRFYDEEDIAQIRFIRHAQRMGFSLEDIAELLAFRAEPATAKPHVRAMVREKLTVLEAKIAELSALHRELEALTKACESSEESDCPILKNFETDTNSP